MEYYSGIKKNEVMPFAATWMDLEITILSQTKISYDITYMYTQKKEKDTNGLIKSRPTDLENKLTVSKGAVGGRHTLGG